MADYTIEKLKDAAGNNFSFRDTSKYTKPSGGIPKSDLASAVQTSLSKADSALQSHQSLDGYVNNIQADSTATFGNESTIVVGKSGKNLLTRTALSLYNYIKGKLDSVYAAMNHVHSVKINGTTKTIAASGGTAVDLGSYDTSGTASSAVSAHNSSSSAHSSLFGAKADNTPTFSQASTRANLSGSGETMPTILGKIKKFFADLKALAFKDKVADGDISGTISDSHIASASTWNGKANANGSNASGTWDIDINGNAKTATAADEAIFQGAIRIGTTAVDLNTLVNDAPGEKLYWCSSSSIENVTNKPSSLTTGFLLRVQSPLSDGVDTMQFLYPRGTAAYYYVRRCTVAEGSSWSSWTQQWYGPTSTYDTSTTRAINSSAVASAIETKENTFNKVSSWSSDTTDTHYPSEKLVKDSLDAKADLTDLSRHVIAAAGSAARWVNIIDVNVADFDYWSYPIYIVAYSRGGAVHNAFIEFNHSSTMSIRNATDLVIGSEQGFTVASTYPLCYVLDTQNNKLHIWMYMHVRGPGEFVVRTTQRTFLSKFSYPSETTAVSSDGRPDGAVEFTRLNGITNDERDTWNAKADLTDVPYIINANSATTAIFDEAVSRYYTGKLVFIRKGVYMLQCVGASSTQLLFESVAGGTAGISKGVIDWRRGTSVPSVTWLQQDKLNVIHESRSRTLSGGQFVDGQRIYLGIYVSAGKQFTGTITICRMYTTDTHFSSFDAVTPGYVTMDCNYGAPSLSSLKIGHHVLPVYENNTGDTPSELWILLRGTFEQQDLTIYVDGIEV